MNVFQFILYYITIFFSSICLCVAFSKISGNIFQLKLKNIIILLISCLFNILNNYYMISFFRIFIAFIITFFMIRLIFKIDLKEVFINVVIIAITSLILDIISSNVLFFVPNINDLNDSVILKVLVSLFSSLALLFIYNSKMLNYIEKIKQCIKNFVNFYIFSLLIIFILSLICYFRSIDLANIPLIFTAIISLVFILICLKIIINDKYNNKVLLEKNKNLKDSYKAYSETLEECKELNHNLKNDLYSLKASLPKKYQTQANNLIIKYNKDYDWINRIDEIPEGLQGIIYLKINEAAQKKVKIILNTIKNIDALEKDYLDLCSIIGILIDNAVEASKNAKSKLVEINITETKNDIYIKIINKFTNTIDLNKIGKKNYSTKEYKSGLGLNYIKKVKNNNIKVNFNIISDLFITCVKYKQNVKKSS